MKRLEGGPIGFFLVIMLVAGSFCTAGQLKMVELASLTSSSGSAMSVSEPDVAASLVDDGLTISYFLE